ncbi:SDR family NAD(P)-dependent oxidoreductase [Pseudomonas aestiva]|uniref:SDR family NAD(P)-dependent oxidoreductase n=1 Tax=Pseudomonas aestiva TaxID=3136739 RepID=UPI003263CD69
MSQPTAIVLGVGSVRGVGGAVCKRFAREGYHVVVVGRTAAKIDTVVAEITALGVDSAEAFPTDVTDETQVMAAFDRAMSPGTGREPADVVISNAGNNAVIDFTQLTAAQFEDFWRVGCYSGFLIGREAARRLMPLGRGTVIFTGASGSLRGKPGYAHFAAAKAGLRMIAQSMAREYGPKEVHVAHVVIDGGVSGDRLQAVFPGRDLAESDDLLG